MPMNGWKNKGDTYTIRHKTYFSLSIEYSQERFPDARTIRKIDTSK